MRGVRILLVGIMAMGLSRRPGRDRPAARFRIRVSWVAPVSNWASIWLEKKDLAQHLGKSYTMEPVRYAGTPPMVTALASGELEVANLAYSTLAIAIQNAGIGRPQGDRRTSSATGFPAVIRTSTSCWPTAPSRTRRTSRAR